MGKNLEQKMLGKGQKMEKYKKKTENREKNRSENQGKRAKKIAKMKTETRGLEGKNCLNKLRKNVQK